MDAVLLRRAMNHALTLLLSSMTITCCWFYLRLPGASLLLVTFTFLVASLLYDVKSWTERLRIALKIALLTGILQFLIGITIQTQYLALLLPGTFNYLLLTTLHNRQAACIVLVAGHLGYFAPGGFMPSVSRMIELFYSAGSVILATSLAGVVHLRTGYETLLRDPFTKEEALGMSLALLSGSFLMHALHFPQGAWIVLTIAFLYMSQNDRFSMYYFATRRIFAVPTGLLCGFLFMACLTYFNAYMIYFLPLLGTLTFFLLYVTGSYFWYTVFFMMTFALYTDFSIGSDQELNILSLTASRSLATVTGAAIALLFHHCFLQANQETLQK